jgi:excisionase family DNA binding protein
MELTLLCPKDVARLLSVSPRTASRLMASGEIESCRVGPRHWRLRTTAERVFRYQQRRFQIGTRNGITPEVELAS